MIDDPKNANNDAPRMLRKHRLDRLISNQFRRVGCWRRIADG